MSYLQVVTIVHTALSLLAIVAGIPAIADLFRGGVHRVAGRMFVGLAIATSVTGFIFPFHGMTPAIATGIVALAVLGAMLVARQRLAVARAWQRVNAAGIVISLYLLVFVGIVQAFQKVAVLHRLAPTQTEAPFVATQLAALALFILLTIAAGLRPALGTAAMPALAD